jgi:hypothetical protein
MASPPETLNPNNEPGKTLLGVIANILREMWRSGGLSKITIYLLLLLKGVVFSKLVLISVLCGTGGGLLFALGQSYAIGFYAAWKIYGLWWVVSPLFGPLLLLLMAVAGLVGEYLGELAQRKAKFIIGSIAVVVLGTVFLVGGYKGAREDNPLLSSQPANLGAISKSVGEQSRILGGLSETGMKLLSQLNATEIELEAAKKQLSVTLGNFDAQRHAAQQVTEELRQLDDRQKQIALQTGELERILDGQRPITRHDLQLANMQGLISGLVVGFVTSLLGSISYNALRKRKPL